MLLVSAVGLFFVQMRQAELIVVLWQHLCGSRHGWHVRGKQQPACLAGCCLKASAYCLKLRRRSSNKPKANNGTNIPAGSATLNVNAGALSPSVAKVMSEWILFEE